ncbi:MAG: hypothetical protein IJ418_00870 [Clostridia bacterium]|nr:hypothetical protein [Clostridia bacterium]
MLNELEQLRAALSEGKITKADMQSRLSVLVEDAYMQSPVDEEYIAACENLLKTLMTGERELLTSVSRDCQKVIRENSHIVRPVPLRGAGRFAAVAAVLVLLFCLGEFALDHAWISGNSTTDGETYVIRQHHLDAGFVSASAIEYIDDGSAVQFSTQSQDELVSYLGFEPPLIDAAELGLNAEGQYDVFTSESSRTIIQTYSNAGTGGEFRWLTIAIIDYAAPDNVLFAFQQSRPGKTTRLDSGLEVYVASCASGKPLEEQACVSVTWMEEARVYHVSGVLDEEQMLEIVENFGETGE